MSSVLLLKDWKESKAGEVVSVPFPLGRELLLSGIGKYLSDVSVTPIVSPVVPEPVVEQKAREEEPKPEPEQESTPELIQEPIAEAEDKPVFVVKNEQWPKQKTKKKS